MPVEEKYNNEMVHVCTEDVPRIYVFLLRTQSAMPVKDRAIPVIVPVLSSVGRGQDM